MNLFEYLNRIQYTGDIKPDMATLVQLQQHHLLHIPFENLDIQAKIPIVLDPKKFYEKLVTNKRGGYCYEQNGLFHEMLKAIGYKVTMISGRVAHDGKFSPEYDHLALIVNFGKENGRWLVDVGFGDFAMKPLLIDTTATQFDGRNNYRIRDSFKVDGSNSYGVERWKNAAAAYIPDYAFRLSPRKLLNFTKRNEYQQHNPKSYFVQNLICSIATPKGRVSMVNNKLIITTTGKPKELGISDETHRKDLLVEYFGMGGQPIEVFNKKAT
jgi:N-hydroxyarylamine O-acetyltransferase